MCPALPPHKEPSNRLAIDHTIDTPKNLTTEGSMEMSFFALHPVEYLISMTFGAIISYDSPGRAGQSL
jgi:hypothetical protein